MAGVSAPSEPARWLPAVEDLRRALLAAAAVCVAVGLTALVVALAFAGDVRAGLDFGFAGLPRTFEAGGSIFVHNVRLMAAIAAAALVVQSPRLGVPAGTLGGGGRVLRSATDALLAAAVAANAGVVGAAVGAYGWRMIEAMMPFAPLELAAYALALALYLRARTERLGPRGALVLAAWAVGLLAVAAFTEALLHF